MALFFSDDCPLDVTPPDLPDYVSCKLSDKCTEVDCNTDLEFLQRTIHIRLGLNPCLKMLEFGIERFKHLVSFFDVSLGTEMSAWIGGIFRLT